MECNTEKNTRWKKNKTDFFFFFLVGFIRQCEITESRNFVRFGYKIEIKYFVLFSNAFAPPFITTTDIVERGFYAFLKIWITQFLYLVSTFFKIESTKNFLNHARLMGSESNKKIKIIKMKTFLNSIITLW